MIEKYNEFHSLNESDENFDFEKEKEKIIDEYNSFYKKYLAFTSIISSKNWRVNILPGKLSFKSTVNDMSLGSQKEFDYMIEQDAEGISLMKKYYPELYKKYFKVHTSNEFNL